MTFHCALFINSDMTEKIKTDIVCSDNPVDVLENKNKRKEKKLSRELKKEEKWSILVIVCPFDTLKDAQDFQTAWEKRSRGIHSRMRRGCKLAGKRGLEVYINSNASELEQAKKIWLAARNNKKKSKKQRTQK